MNEEKISKFQDEIKKLYFDLDKKSPEKKLADFWNIHLKFVIDKSKELADKYGADKEVVWLAAILHDIGQMEGLEPHEEIGAEKAHKLLLEKGCDREIARKVKETILTHRVNQHKPEILEQKILATADAMSHFQTPHYIWLSSVYGKALEELFSKLSKKIGRDFSEKIYFDDEKHEVIREYEVLKNWFKIK